MIEALIDGERDTAVLADLAKAPMRKKISELTEALNGRFGNITLLSPNGFLLISTFSTGPSTS